MSLIRISFCRPICPLGVKLLAAQQYAMCYMAPKPEEVNRTREKLGLFSDTLYAVVGGDQMRIPKSERMLPLAFEATDGTLMLLRQTLVVVDTTKFSEEQLHNRQYAALLMYMPWQDESIELGLARLDAAVCDAMVDRHKDALRSVKEGCRRLLG
jgi:hypothetical protein